MVTPVVGQEEENEEEDEDSTTLQSKDSAQEEVPVGNKWPLFLRWRRRILIPHPLDSQKLRPHWVTAGTAGTFIPVPLAAIRDLVHLSATQDPHCIPITLGMVYDLECSVTS